jgi:tRNA dimethylallyltransferase
MQTEREALYAKIDRRFEQMMNGGAVEEVQHLRGLFSEDEWEEARYPVLKAIGVAEISAYLDGALSREEATELAQRNTRRYAKRQMTWLRGQVSIDEWIAASV